MPIAHSHECNAEGSLIIIDEYRDNSIASNNTKYRVLFMLEKNWANCHKGKAKKTFFSSIFKGPLMLLLHICDITVQKM